MILNKILQALGYLILALIIYFAYNTASKEAEKSGLRTALWKGFLWCGGIALVMSINLGSPTCTDLEQDTRGSTCNEYADDGFKPTTEERASEFAYYMTLFYLPVAIGAYEQAKHIK